MTRWGGADRTAVKARIATSAMFFTNGAIFASIVPRYPEIKEQLELSNAAYGVVIAMNPVGAMVAGLAAAALLRRFGSANVAAATSVGLAVGVLGAALSPAVIPLALALFFAGTMDAITDVAQNAHGLRVQKRMGKSIINSLHAIWSAGAVSGGALAAGAIALGLSPAAHIAITSTLFALVALVARTWALPGPESESGRTEEIRIATAAGGVTARTVVVVAALVVIAMGGGLIEDVGATWTALYLGGIGADPVLAAAGFTVLILAQFVGRMVSDPITDRFGPRTVTLAGGLFIAVGVGLAILVPTVPTVLVGFALAGFGSAPIIPLAMQEADRLPGLRPGTGLTIVTWLMRMAFLFSPPLVGLIADGVSLRAGLLVSAVGGILVVALCGALPRREKKE